MGRARVPPVTVSTPDALWSSRSVRLLRPAAVTCDRLRSGERRSPLIDGLNLRVGVGARLLLVGIPDDASRVLLRILAGLSRPGGGRYRLAGAVSPDRSASGWGRRIAYVGPDPVVYAWMSGAETLALSARLLGLERSEAKRRVDEAIVRWGLTADLDRPIRRLGPAYAERVAMAAALLGDQEIVLLDEPLRSVPPDERVRMLRLRGLRRTVLLASRYPASEAGAVGEVALIRDGTIAVHAPVSALTERGLPLTHRGIGALAQALSKRLDLPVREASSRASA
jgi:ABC-type multidrug transport system ATPase subunit